MYSKSVTYKFTSFTSAKIAAGHCTEYLSRHVVKLEMSSLTITVSKESEVSVSANFDDIGNLIIELNKNSLSSEQFIKKLSLIVLDPKYRIQLGMLIILISFIIYIVSVL